MLENIDDTIMTNTLVNLTGTHSELKSVGGKDPLKEKINELIDTVNRQELLIERLRIQHGKGEITYDCFYNDWI